MYFGQFDFRARAFVEKITLKANKPYSSFV